MVKIGSTCIWLVIAHKCDSIEVIDFLYFRHQKKYWSCFFAFWGISTPAVPFSYWAEVQQEETFSLWKLSKIWGCCPISHKGYCLPLHPGLFHNQYKMPFLACVEEIRKKLYNWTQTDLHNPLPTKPGFFGRRWKRWRSEDLDSNKPFYNPVKS